ncbi:MAG: methionyl-tRNA formyltransferase [Pseudomonadota bacterium]
MRLAFMGTPDFSVPILQALIGAGHEIAAVYTQPPRPAGRGKAPRPSPVQTIAEGHDLMVRTPESFREMAVIQEFAVLQVDAAVVVAFGQILPPEALTAPRLGCLNLHASLLPRWRGAAPIQRAIMAGDDETGIAVMQMEAGLDTGPVWAEVKTPISAEDTAGSLHDRLAAMGAQLIIEALPQIAAGERASRPQSADGVTYAKKIDKAEARVDWSLPAEAIDRQIRGLSPFPGAWCEVAGQRVKLLHSCAEPGDGPPGAVLDQNLLVACGAGAVRLTRLQRAGKGPVDASAFLNGTDLPPGSQLT